MLPCSYLDRGVKLINELREETIDNFGGWGWGDVLCTLTTYHESDEHLSDRIFSTMFCATSPVVNLVNSPSLMTKEFLHIVSPALFKTEILRDWNRQVGIVMRELRDKKWREWLLQAREKEKAYQKFKFEKANPDHVFYASDWDWL